MILLYLYICEEGSLDLRNDFGGGSGDALARWY